MDARITAIIARMEATVDQSPGLPELAAAVNLSVSRLSHLFRAEVGVPPARYLHAIRMQRARILLERTSLTVKEVMAKVGVADPSHFARDFRRYHGIPPSQVRRGRGEADNPPALLMTHLKTAADAAHGAGPAANASADPHARANGRHDGQNGGEDGD